MYCILSKPRLGLLFYSIFLCRKRSLLLFHSLLRVAILTLFDWLFYCRQRVKQTFYPHGSRGKRRLLCLINSRCRSGSLHVYLYWFFCTIINFTGQKMCHYFDIFTFILLYLRKLCVYARMNDNAKTNIFPANLMPPPRSVIKTRGTGRVPSHQHKTNNSYIQ